MAHNRFHTFSNTHTTTSHNQGPVLTQTAVPNHVECSFPSMKTPSSLYWVSIAFVVALECNTISKSNAPDPTTESTPETSTMPANGTTSFVPPPSGAYERLKAAAKDRKMQINATWMDGISLSYDPAAKVILMLL
ncbi:hypothetical protein K439DRAFT_1620220 [Ramaria rubella]|nr:hypothetical protein K439DRAFT_1620220 [Ramaria rubella]